MGRFHVVACVVLVLTAARCRADDGVENDNDDGSVEEVKNVPPRRVFQPTSEWQVVEEDMAIPRGLHVRMDFQTGVKEAKLLDPEDAGTAVSAGNENDDQVHVLPRDLREGVINTKKVVLTRDQVAEQLAEPVSSPSSSTPAGLTYEDDAPDKRGDDNEPESVQNIAEKIIRTRNAMKKKLPRADVEVMQELVKVLANQSSTLVERTAALTELEFYVHQIDNARDLNAIGGLVLLVRGLNDTDREFRNLAALTLGGAMQG